MTQYRILGNEEIVRNGDECRRLPKTEWEKVGSWAIASHQCASWPDWSFRRRIHKKTIQETSVNLEKTEESVLAPKYRLLDIGEGIKKGDEWRHSLGKTWALTNIAGAKHTCPNQVYRRKIGSSEGITFLNELKALVAKYKDTPGTVTPLYKQLVATIALVGENGQ